MIPAAQDHTDLMFAGEPVETMQLKPRGSIHIFWRQGLATAAVE
jgi:hypothetical protein